MNSAVEYLRNDDYGMEGTVAQLAIRATDGLADPEFITNAMAEFIEEILVGMDQAQAQTS